MESILRLFSITASILATLTLFLPIVYSIIAIRKKKKMNFDMKMFLIYCYITLVGQLISYSLAFGFGMQNILLFRIYLPLHTALFTYFLLKWIGLEKKHNYLAVIAAIIISFAIDLIFGDQNYSPIYMFWFDAIILFVLSFYLSYISDKKKLKHSCEKHYIHIGIYLYSLITILGITPQKMEIHHIAFFLQAAAVMVSGIYFGRSFKCLYR